MKTDKKNRLKIIIFYACAIICVIALLVCTLISITNLKSDDTTPPPSSSSTTTSGGNDSDGSVEGGEGESEPNDGGSGSESPSDPDGNGNTIPPEEPNNPEVPETPENPSTPEIPEVPENPSTPEIPEVPENPDDKEEETKSDAYTIIAAIVNSPNLYENEPYKNLFTNDAKINEEFVNVTDTLMEDLNNEASYLLIYMNSHAGSTECITDEMLQDDDFLNGFHDFMNIIYSNIKDDSANSGGETGGGDNTSGDQGNTGEDSGTSSTPENPTGSDDTSNSEDTNNSDAPSDSVVPSDPSEPSNPDDTNDSSSKPVTGEGNNPDDTNDPENSTGSDNSEPSQGGSADDQEPENPSQETNPIPDGSDTGTNDSEDGMGESNTEPEIPENENAANKTNADILIAAIVNSDHLYSKSPYNLLFTSDVKINTQYVNVTESFKTELEETANIAVIILNAVTGNVETIPEVVMDNDDFKDAFDDFMDLIYANLK